MLIDSQGEKQGIVSIGDALDAAKNVSLDLVQVSSSDADPVVCKILDYGKHLFDKKKSSSSSKVKSKITEVAQPVSQEVKDAPKRAKNDPRYKSE